MTEIEIKAHVADPAATETIVRAFATPVRETVKSDVYWAREGNAPRGTNGARYGKPQRYDSKTLTAAISMIMTFVFAISAAISVIAGADKRIAIGICLGGFVFTAVMSWALKRGLDRYRSSAAAKTREDPSQPVKVRIREEAGTVVVTYKRKELKGEVEVNDEREFSIDDREAFESLLADLEFKPYSTKEKNTKTFDYRAPDGTKVSVELSLVTGLGWFTELEILADEPSEDQTAAAIRTLRSTLALMGIPETAIETRHYTDMLRESEERDRSHLPNK